MSTETVLQWKQRFAAEGIAGLIGWPATSGAALGHRRRNGDAEIIRTSLAESAANPSRSATAREVAEQANVGVTIVVRAWRQYGITPHRAGGWMFYISPGTSHGPPLADSLRSQHDSGQRCRWLN